MSNARSEHDSLGNVFVPADALYGAQTARAIGNFPISGRSAPAPLIRAYLRLKAAAATANQQCGALSTENADLIICAVAEILAIPEARWPEIFPVDVYQAGAGTSQNMNMNEVIANVANRIAGKALGTYSPIHPNDHVNCSQSTNDSYPTAMRMALFEAGGPLIEAIDRLAAALADKARQWDHLPKAGRTHLQDAVPMRLGQEFAAYASVLQRCSRWLAGARDQLRELGIGGSAAGTGLNVPAGFVPLILQALGRLAGSEFRGAPNLCEATQSQAPVYYFSAMLRLTALEMTRVLNDLRLLASGPQTGLAEIQLPAVQPGSSIMPGKVNPSILEMANQTWFAVLGYDHTVAMAAQAGQLELNVMMPVMAYSLLEATKIATQATTVLRTACVEGLRADEAKLRHYFENTSQVATALSPKLGYETTAKLVQEAIAKKQSVLALVRERGLIPEAELAELLDLGKLTGN